MDSLGGVAGIGTPARLGASSTAGFHVQRHAGSGVAEVNAAVEDDGVRVDDKTPLEEFVLSEPSQRQDGEVDSLYEWMYMTAAPFERREDPAAAMTSAS